MVKPRARALIREHPGAFARLTLLKFFHFWWYPPTTSIPYPRAWFQLYMAYYGVALVLGMVGAWRAARGGGRGMPLAALMGAFLLVLASIQSLYYVEGRHGWAVEPVILVFSGGGVASLLMRRGNLDNVLTRSRRVSACAQKVPK